MIIPGNGALFWNGGMRKAWEWALQKPTDFYLWLNDDLAVREGALGDALATYWEHAATTNDRVIVVGRTVDGETGETTYGGFNRGPGRSRLRFRRLRGNEIRCVTMNGNFVLIPSIASSEVGINSSAYRHSFGDIDYGLRAHQLGYEIIQLATPVGTQSLNVSLSKANSTITAANFYSVLTQPKRVPAREWLYFCRQHAGPLWPINFSLRYIKMALRGATFRSNEG
jgi:GT2 family glycosyltransferase